MACRIADGVTRRALKEGTPIVAFLVERNKRYPYGDNPNEAPIYPKCAESTVLQGGDG
jgi:hypothetical protein